MSSEPRIWKLRITQTGVIFYSLYKSLKALLVFAPVLPLKVYELNKALLFRETLLEGGKTFKIGE